MKKTIIFLITILILVLIYVSIFVLSTNDNNQKSFENTNDIEEPKKIENIDEQIEIIAKNIDKWKTYEEYANDTVQYVITDLDHNGRLEIILTQMGGSGYFSYNNYYEVDSNFQNIIECGFDEEEGYSEADLSISDEVDVYYDKTLNNYYYIFTDVMKTNPNEYYEGIYSINLKDCKVNEYYIASKMTTYDFENDNNEINTYSDQYEKNITEEEYNSSANNYYFDYEKTSLKLNWKSIFELNELSEQNIIDKLKDSLSL